MHSTRVPVSIAADDEVLRFALHVGEAAIFFQVPEHVGDVFEADKQIIWIAKDTNKVLKISANLVALGGAKLTSELTQ